MRRALLPFFLTLLAPAALWAQSMGGGGSVPLALDLRKVPVGSWAEYNTTITMPGQGSMTVTQRWSLVGRSSSSNTMEINVQGGPLAQMGGKMTTKLVTVANPIGAEKPLKELVAQIGDRDPMEMPLDQPNVPTQRFKKPDPKMLVGKEEIKVPGGTFKTSHYRDAGGRVTVETWVSEQVPPLGVVKVTITPKGDAVGPGGQPMPPMTMELSARGKDAKPQITKPAKPFDPSVLGGGPMHGPPPGAAPAPKP